MTERASISSSFHHQWTYDVFLNFRGQDTRHSFTGHLYRALIQRGIRTFFDDEEIRKGDEVGPALVKAIEESRMAITVFSKDYASSTFCLDELVQIHQCIKKMDRLVWPIFYQVEPSEVRHQKENYKQALATHEQKLRVDEKKMQNWKLALHEIANVCGYHINPGHDYEYRFIEGIVNEISSIIIREPLHVAEFPVGLDSRQQKINSLLQIGSNDKVIMVGICGIGGMGKTTIVRAVYNSIANNFEGLCFLHDIKEQSKKIGLEQMQERMVFKILGVMIKIEDINEGVAVIRKRLKQKKILLILDNVDRREQLQTLAGQIDWFRSGSRIIITTRDKQLLLGHGVERIYDIEGFNDKESLELLSWNAFRNKQVDPSYNEVLNHVICYAQGVPLALEVIGSHLYGKGISEWESALNIYKRIPDEDIQQILKVSYDGLKQVEKEIFLDIACFFKGKSLEYVKNLVEHTHGVDPNYSIGVLVDKYLIKIENGHIEMHNLIEDMGREIVRQESPNEPGKRSRLWFHEDIVNVLEENSGTNEVRIIISDYLFIEVNWDGKAFKNMKNLKILIFENLKFSKGPKYLPNSLKVLKWRGYPSSCLPRDFCPNKLVVLELGYSLLNSVEIIKMMLNLSVLNLRGCKDITKIPNLSGLSNLKELDLTYCTNLIEIDGLVMELPKLVYLDVYKCTQLKIFPLVIKAPSLEVLGLGYCSIFKNFPEILEKVKIKSLTLDETVMEKLPSSICNLAVLTDKYINSANKIRSIDVPSGNCLLPEPTKIDVGGYAMLPMEVSSMVYPILDLLCIGKCSISNEMLQMYLTSFINIRQLDLSASDFTILPACIKECRFLSSLDLQECKHLREVEGIPPNLDIFFAEDCISLSLESRNLLFSEELHVPRVINCTDETYFCMPGEIIPKWFDHNSKGCSISFWFRTHFPTPYVCALFEPHDPYIFSLKLLINEVSVTGNVDWEWKLGPAREGYHIVFFDLTRKFFDDEMKQAFQEGEWNHAKVILGQQVVEEMGIYIIKEDNKMEDIRFSHPYQSLDFMSVVDQEKVSSLKASKLIIWRRPEYAWYKMNVDGATSDYKGNSEAACGGVCRDAAGGFVFGFMHNTGIGDAHSLLHAQLWGCFLGLKSAWDWGIQTLVLETDSIEVLNILLYNVVNVLEEQLILQIREVIYRSWQVKVSWVPREANFAAHNLANKALTVHPGFHFVTSPAPPMEDIQFTHPLDSMSVEQERVSWLKGNFPSKLIKWWVPKYGWYKMNVGGATSKSKGNLEVACGGVCRDAQGRFVFGFMHNIGIGDAHSLLQVKLWGCLLGLKSAWDWRITSLVLETDSIELKDILVGDVLYPSEKQLILQIREVMYRSWQVKVSRVPRGANFAAQKLAKKALSVYPGFHFFTSTPTDLL